MNRKIENTLDFASVYNQYKTDGVDYCIPKLKNLISKAKSISHAILVIDLIDKIKIEISLDSKLSNFMIEIRPYVDDFLNIELSILPFIREGENVILADKNNLDSHYFLFIETINSLFSNLFQNVSEFSFLGDIVDSISFKIDCGNFNADHLMKSLLSKKIYVATTKHLLDIDLKGSSDSSSNSTFIKV